VTASGSVCDQLVQNLDYAQTFLDAAGVEAPNDLQGRSLVPLLKGESPNDWRKSIYYHYYEYPSVHMVPNHVGVRTDRYKLIHYYPFNEWEYFDLDSDPDEQHNLFGVAEHATQIAALACELGRLRAFYHDDDELVPFSNERQAELRAAHASSGK
jgi:arylsulfatase A-like enzyme